MPRDGVFSYKACCFSFFFGCLILRVCWLLCAIWLLFMYRDGFVPLKDELVMFGARLPGVLLGGGFGFG